MNKDAQDHEPSRPLPDDHDLTFFLGMYRDSKRAEGALTRLRSHYPSVRIILRSDGDPNPDNQRLAARYHAEYHSEERLFPIQNGGAMVARTLDLFLAQPTKFLFRMDTDTAFFRRFRYFPEKDGIFGSLQRNREKCLSIQGGCTGFTLNAARKIQESGLLEDPRLAKPQEHSVDSAYFRQMARRAERCGLGSFDWIIGWVATELGISMIPFEEVHCRWHPEGNCDNEDLRFAVTHPVYF